MSDDDEHEKYMYAKRIKLVHLSKTDYNAFIEYLRANDPVLRTFDDDAKEELRRTCQRSYENAYSVGENDERLFDSIFGQYREPYPKESNTLKTEKEIKENPDNLPIERRLQWYSGATYHNFWKFVHSESFTENISQIDRKTLTDCIRYAISNDYCPFPDQKHYEQEDMRYYITLGYFG